MIDYYDLIHHHLNKWCSEYGIDNTDIEPHITDRLRELHYLGLTTFKYDTFNIRYCIVELSDKLDNEAFAVATAFLSSPFMSAVKLISPEFTV